MYPSKFVERFWSKVDKSGPDECWLWKGSLNDCGYGQVYLGTGEDKVQYRTHRVSLELSLGRPIGPGLCALHRCVKTRHCVNPAHLYEGTKLDNGRDKARDGTQKGLAAGERNPKAKLTPADVAEIQKLSGAGASRISLAERFGVGASTISKVVLGRTWTAPN